MGNLQLLDNLPANTARHCPAGLGAGSTIRVALPAGALLGGEDLSGAAAGVLQAAGGVRTMSRGPILVVDDDPVIRRTVAEILEMEEYSVETAPDGAKALQAVERQRPGLVLLDMRMPVLDGWGFAQALRERDIAIPIVVMTAAQDSARWAAEVGAAGYLAKPFELLDLLDAVERIYGAA